MDNKQMKTLTKKLARHIMTENDHCDFSELLNNITLDVAKRANNEKGRIDNNHNVHSRGMNSH